MNLVDFIKKLQRQPRAVRVQIMWLGSIFGIAIIFSLWVWSLGGLLSTQNTAKTASDQQLTDNFNQVKQDLPTLWQSLTAGIGDVTQSIKDGINQMSAANNSASPAPSAQSNVQTSEQPAEQLPVQ